MIKDTVDKLHMQEPECAKLVLKLNLKNMGNMRLFV